MTDLRPTPLNTINELAKERNRAAAERTLNAWTALCLSLMGFGVAFEQVSRRWPGATPNRVPQPSVLVGIGFVGMGVVLLGLALVQHRLTINALERQDRVLDSFNSLNRLAVIAILLAGLAGLGATLWLAGA